MKKHKIVCSVILLTVIILGINLIIPPAKSTIENLDENNTIYVSTNGIGNYTRIQDAINNASDGDTIFIFNGTYYEDITVDKSVTLYGENRNNTVIDGEYAPVIVSVIVDHVVINNLTIRNSGASIGNAGIKLNSENNHIIDCTLYRTKTGIYVNNADNNEIKGCIFYINGEGIFFNASSDISINNSYFVHNAIAVCMKNSSWLSTRNSYSHTNGMGFFIKDSSHIAISKCAIYNNNDNQGGIFTSDSRYVDITNCNLFHNGFGLRLEQSSSIWINRCSIDWNTHFGVTIGSQSTDITILNCDISHNFRYGIRIVENSYANIHDNNIYDNTLYGVFCENSYSNAQNNWWGASMGTSFTEFGRGDKIAYKNRCVGHIPWRFVQLENVGADWIINYNFSNIDIPVEQFRIINLTGIDSDNDSIPDWWEEKYGYDPYSWDNHTALDPDGDGLNNVEECFTDQWGSNPYHKDIFMEFDWMVRYPGDLLNKPSGEYIDQMVAAFEQRNITLHIDTGGLTGGEEIPYKSIISPDELCDIYWDYFLHNDLNNPRKGIFHYCLVCDYGPYAGFSFVGCDHLDSFCLSAQTLQENQPKYTRKHLIVGGAIHELGHTLGLTVDDFGGNDNMGVVDTFSKQWWKYHNYKSCMNYRYTYKIIDYSDGSHGRGDFDDWGHLDFSFFKNTHFRLPEKYI